MPCSSSSRNRPSSWFLCSRRPSRTACFRRSGPGPTTIRFGSSRPACCARTWNASARPRASRSSRESCPWSFEVAAARRGTRSRLLDQLIAGAGPTGITYARTVGLLGVTDVALLDDMVDALAAGDAAAVYGTVDRVVEAGHDPRRFTVDLLDRFRDLLVLAAVPDAADRGLLDAPEDELTRMVEQAGRLGIATVTRFAEIVHTALIEIRGTTSPRLVLELLCARMQLPDAATDSAALLQRVERLERRLAATQSGMSAESAAPEAGGEARRRLCQTHRRRRRHRHRPRTGRPPPPSDPVEQRCSAAATMDAVAIRQLWPAVLDTVKRGQQRTRAALARCPGRERGR